MATISAARGKREGGQINCLPPTFFSTPLHSTHHLAHSSCGCLAFPLRLGNEVKKFRRRTTKKTKKNRLTVSALDDSPSTTSRKCGTRPCFSHCSSTRRDPMDVVVVVETSVPATSTEYITRNPRSTAREMFLFVSSTLECGSSRIGLEKQKEG